MYKGSESWQSSVVFLSEVYVDLILKEGWHWGGSAKDRNNRRASHATFSCEGLLELVTCPQRIGKVVTEDDCDELGSFQRVADAIMEALAGWISHSSNHTSISQNVRSSASRRTNGLSLEL